LREMYGSTVNKMKLEFVQFKNRSGRSFEITAAASSVHTEINASDAGNNDHYAVKTAIKQMAQTKSLGIAASFSAQGAGSADKVSGKKQKQFRVLILTEADKLTKGAQQVRIRRIQRETPPRACVTPICCSCRHCVELWRSTPSIAVSSSCARARPRCPR